MPVQGTIVDLTVPFEGESDFFFVRASTWDTAPPHATIERKQLYAASIAWVKFGGEGVELGSNLLYRT